MYKACVSNDYDLIVLDSPKNFETYELERMKTMALDISKSKNKIVTIAYHSYISDYLTCGNLQ